MRGIWRRPKKSSMWEENGSAMSLVRGLPVSIPDVIRLGFAKIWAVIILVVKFIAVAVSRRGYIRSFFLFVNLVGLSFGGISIIGSCIGSLRLARWVRQDDIRQVSVNDLLCYRFNANIFLKERSKCFNNIFRLSRVG